MSHMIMYKNEKGILIGIVEWRYRPLTARQSIRLFDLLKLQSNFVLRCEDNTRVERWDGFTDDRNLKELRDTPHHYEDGTIWLKEVV